MPESPLAERIRRMLQRIEEKYDAGEVDAVSYTSLRQYYIKRLGELGEPREQKLPEELQLIEAFHKIKSLYEGITEKREQREIDLKADRLAHDEFDREMTLLSELEKRGDGLFNTLVERMEQEKLRNPIAKVQDEILLLVSEINQVNNLVSRQEIDKEEGDALAKAMRNKVYERLRKLEDGIVHVRAMMQMLEDLMDSTDTQSERSEFIMSAHYGLEERLELLERLMENLHGVF